MRLVCAGTPDVAVVINDGPRRDAAGVFTSNRVQAAPVLWSRQVLTDGQLQAVVLNSGGANACTGRAGLADARQMAEWTAEAIGADVTDVAVCSTGLIGVRLPMDKISAAIPDLVRGLSTDGGATFPRRMLIEDGPGTCTSNDSTDGRNREMSYPWIWQAPDGTLHLAYTYHRRAIKYVRLSPKAQAALEEQTA